MWIATKIEKGRSEHGNGEMAAGSHVDQEPQLRFRLPLRLLGAAHPSLRRRHVRDEGGPELQLPQIAGPRGADRTRADALRGGTIHHRRRTFRLTALAALLLAGCASLTPAQEQSVAEIEAFAERTARSYSLPPIPVLVSHNPRSPAGSYRRGFFSVNALTLTSSFRDAIVAHELAHYVLGHDAPLRGPTFETVYLYLLGVHWALERYPRMDLVGHKPPCEEIADLLGRFPLQRGWTAALECAPTQWRTSGG